MWLLVFLLFIPYILSQVQEFEYKVIFSQMSSIVIIHWIPCTVHETVWSVDLYTLVLPLLSYHGWVNKNLSAKVIVSSIIFTG